MNVPYEKPRILSVTAEHVARLEHENEKLRHDLEEANNQAEEVCIENAKLRELVRSMYYDLSNQTFPPDWVVEYKADLLELGIEVEA